jgi:cation diffusion facilitator family transporter
MVQPRLKYPILVSMLAALLTLALKWAAYALTGSVGILSDATESFANLLAAIIAFFSLWYSSQPVDPTHTYGHEKIEYFSSGLEGSLIIVAAIGIAWYAVRRLIEPEALQELDLGVVLGLAASLINLAAARIILRSARKNESIVLEADGRHLMADVTTTLAVVASLLVVRLTKMAGLELKRLDPIMGLAMAAYIVWTGYHLVRRSFDGLMDHALPEEVQAAVRAAIEARLGPGMDFHALRTRQAGARKFVDFHLLVPGALSVRRAHEMTGSVEESVRAALPGAEVTVHIEPIEERSAWEDSDLLPLEQAAKRQRAESGGGTAD